MKFEGNIQITLFRGSINVSNHCQSIRNIIFNRPRAAELHLTPFQLRDTAFSILGDITLWPAFGLVYSHKSGIEKRDFEKIIPFLLL